MSVSDSAFPSDMKSPYNSVSAIRKTCIGVCLMLSMTGIRAQTLSEQTYPPLTSQKTRHSILDIRFKNIVRQNLDFSCGAAALSTLLTYYFEDPTPESEILEILETSLGETENSKRALSGYSLLDLKNAAEAKGYDAAGYRLSFEQLQRLASPVIVYVVPLGYKHFAVLRGVTGDRVWLADPSRGNLRMSISRFKNEWGGVAFVLGKEGESDISLHPLSISELHDTLPDRIRIQRQLDINERLLNPAIVLPSGIFR